MRDIQGAKSGHTGYPNSPYAATRRATATQENRAMITFRMFAKPAVILLTTGLALSGCSHEGTLKKQRAKCEKISNESERTRCLDKVASDEKEYQRQQNETKIEQNYIRKLEDMKPR
jgi:hypothetical protein